MNPTSTSLLVCHSIVQFDSGRGIASNFRFDTMCTFASDWSGKVKLVFDWANERNEMRET